MMNQPNTRPMPSTSRNWTRAAKRNAGKARRQQARRVCEIEMLDLESDDAAPAPIAPTTSGEFRIIVSTQFYENYGAHDWDGQGECPQYWKAKGGDEFYIPLSLRQVLALGAKGIKALVNEAMDHADVTYRNNYAESYAIDWDLLAPDQKTDMEDYGIKPKLLI